MLAFIAKYRSILQPLGVLLLAVLLLFGCYQKGRWDERSAEAERAAEAQLAQDRRASSALSVSVAEKTVSDAALNDNSSALKGADDAQADSALSPSRLAFNCERMRQQGTDLAKIPSCKRFAGPAKAKAHP